ncbi:type II toxin-antitoxin system VapC family toxin [Pseudorhodoplanes sp.]|uniref:type II toxin-antitoxin system VapC family toxin n=1 Tax=Pseudorhodoplanes sp. TaxID=1934341 RepID=UPI00391D8D01
MASVMVDSNVLIDLLTEDARWFAWSSQAVALEADRQRLVINAIIYAEISVRFSRIDDHAGRGPIPALFSQAVPDRAGLSRVRRGSPAAPSHSTREPPITDVLPHGCAPKTA